MLTPWFSAQGHIIEYRTLQTEGKPKGGRRKQIIAFPVASSALKPMAESTSALASEFYNDPEIGVAPGLSISDQMMTDLKRKFWKWKTLWINHNEKISQYVRIDQHK